MKGFRIVAMLLLTAVFLSSSTIASAGGGEFNVASNYQEDIKEKTISKLLQERASLFHTESVNAAALTQIDSELKRLGCNFFTSQEVDEKFPDQKADRALALSGRTSSSIDTRVTPPSQSNVTWVERRISNYSYNGKRYNIQKLTAIPNDKDSNLKIVGTRTLLYNTPWNVAAQNLIEVAVTNAAGLIPGTTLPLIAYDALSAIITGISRTSEVSSPHISYSWSMTELVVFAYVRLESQTDDYQWLSHISSTTETRVVSVAPGFKYRINSGTGAWEPSPKIDIWEKTFLAMPEYYDSTAAALYAYENTIGGLAAHDCVERIVISGPLDKVAQTISPVYPQFPGHIG